MFKLFLVFLLSFPALAQRAHNVTQSNGRINYNNSTESVADTPEVQIHVDQKYRYIKANGLPSHKVGSFPGPGNPNAITKQSYNFKIPKNPRKTGRIIKGGLPLDFGVALNGVPFDPGAAEYFQGNRQTGWQYEALSGAVPLGIDENHAHVQPTGAYHYHGLPKDLLDSLGVRKGKASPLVGWAADGFPIYALYGVKGKQLRSSYKLKSGRRPSDGPGGTYDGTFVQDYEFIPEHGDLDECNGMTVSNSLFPKGTYAYFLTDTFPVIPRCFKGNPDESFRKSGGGPGRGGERGRGQDRSRRGRRGGPPPEAFSVCRGKSERSSCEFSGRRGEKLEGSCFSGRGGELHCRPRHHHRN